MTWGGPTTNRRCILVALATLSLLFGCSSKSQSSGPCDSVATSEREACLTEHYLEGYTPSGFAPCAGTSTAKINGEKEVEFVLGIGIEDLELQTSGRRLQRYYGDYNLHLFVRDNPGNANFNYLLSGTEQALRARAAELGVNLDDPNPSAGEEAALERVVGEVLGQNIRDVVAARGPNVANRIDIVVSDGIVDPAVQSLIAGEGVILGMGMSPTLFRAIQAQDPTANYFAIYGLPQDFTPVFFVGQDDVRRLVPLLGDSIMAHEFGHALGLTHVSDSSNLMYFEAGAVDCLPGLNDAQVSQLAASTASGAGASSSTTVQHWRGDPFGVMSDARAASVRDHANQPEIPAFARIVKAAAKALRGPAQAPVR